MTGRERRLPRRAADSRARGGGILVAMHLGDDAPRVLDRDTGHGGAEVLGGHALQRKRREGVIHGGEALVAEGRRAVRPGTGPVVPPTRIVVPSLPVFGFSLTELIVVIVVALVVIGPKDLPKMLRNFML